MSDGIRDAEGKRAKWLENTTEVLPGMVGAVRVLQAANWHALQRGAGHGGNTTFEQARILERESGYREMYEALKWALQYGTFEAAEDNPLHARSLDAARGALAKASGEAERTAT